MAPWTFGTTLVHVAAAYFSKALPCCLLAMSSATATFAQSPLEFGTPLGSFEVATEPGGGGQAYIDISGRGCVSLVIVTETHTLSSFDVIRAENPAFQIDPTPSLIEAGIVAEECGNDARIMMVARHTETGEVLGRHGLGRWMNEVAFEQIVSFREAEILKLPTPQVTSEVAMDGQPFDMGALPATERTVLFYEDIPNVTSIPDDRNFGAIVAMMGQFTGSSTTRESPVGPYRPIYARFYPAGCAMVMTIVMPDTSFVPVMVRAPHEIVFERGLLDTLGIVITPCDRVDYFVQYATADGTSFAYLQRFGMVEETIDRAAFDNAIGGAPGFVLPPLPSGLGSFGAWLAMYEGRDILDSNEMQLFYSAIVGAHNRNVLNRGAQCAYDEDQLQTFNSLEEDVYLPAAHKPLFASMLSNARLEPLFMRQARADADAIARADGCRGPRVRILRENLFRALNGQGLLSQDQVERWVSDP